MISRRRVSCLILDEADRPVVIRSMSTVPVLGSIAACCIATFINLFVWSIIQSFNHSILQSFNPSILQSVGLSNERRIRGPDRVLNVIGSDGGGKSHAGMGFRKTDQRLELTRSRADCSLLSSPSSHLDVSLDEFFPRLIADQRLNVSSCVADVLRQHLESETHNQTPSNRSMGQRLSRK